MMRSFLKPNLNTYSDLLTESDDGSAEVIILYFSFCETFEHVTLIIIIVKHLRVRNIVVIVALTSLLFKRGAWAAFSSRSHILIS